MPSKFALDQIKSCVDCKSSYSVSSGAGSGKTYSLVRTVDYVLKKHGRTLYESNQKIKVITYTNAAADEVNNRIGSTELVSVSTIHTWMWELIKNFQTDLLNIHLDKIQSEICRYKGQIDESEYNDDSLLKSKINEEFYKLLIKYYSLPAKEFRKHFENTTKSGKINNVANYKSFVESYYKHNRLISTAKNIQLKTAGYTKVTYTPEDNYDRLYKMKFSHDTLLSYAKTLIETKVIIKRIITDKYPFIFIDEYQDTNPLVVEILSLIDNYANGKCVIGYYGDPFQNIYDKGIGCNLKQTHPGLQDVNLFENKRSAKKIVELGNKIRSDTYNQVAKKSDEGKVEVFYCVNESDEIVSKFINEKARCFPSDEEIHCLVLKNEIVADKSGFGEFYDLLKKTDYYKSNYNNIGTEILSNDINKLGRIPLLIYKWIKFYSCVHNSNELICNYIPKNVYGKINYFQLDQLRKSIINEPFGNLLAFITKVFNKAKEDNNIVDIVRYNINEDFNFERENIRSFFLKSLYNDIPDARMNEALDVIDKIFNLDISILLSWYNYITDQKEKRKIYFHTFHGTKGLEFNNVILIITNHFNRDDKYYHSYFQQFRCLSKVENKDITAKRNLLYVAVTRAKQNLIILYIDPNYDQVRSGFEHIFGLPQEWPN